MYQDEKDKKKKKASTEAMAAAALEKKEYQATIQRILKDQKTGKETYGPVKIMETKAITEEEFNDMPKPKPKKTYKYGK